MNITSGLKKVALTASIAILTASAFAQTTATTVPVGFITVTIPGATPPTINEESAAFAAPLYGSADFQGPVASVSATQINFAGTPLTAGAFDQPGAVATPRAVRVKSAANPAAVGLLFLVSVNTANQVTVVGAPDLTTILAANDTVEILRVNTIGSLFGTTAPILTSGASATVADNVYVLSKNGGADQWFTYFHNGTNWRRPGSGANQNNIIIYPDEAVFIIHRGTSPVVLTVMGTVPSTSEQTDLYGAGSTFLANRFPADTTLLATGIHTSAGWVTGGSAGAADKVYAWDTVARTWRTYFHNGTSWRRTGSGASQDVTVIKAGSGMILQRQSATGVALTQALPYSL
jgi:hypothetical protein